MFAYTAEVLFALVAQYNAAIWPAQIAACFLAGLMLVHAVRPFGAWGDRLAGAALAAFWLWTAVAFQLVHMAAIDFTAPFAALAFLLQGLLLAWTASFRGRVAFRFRRDAAGWLGLALALYGLAGHPAVLWLSGRGWPHTPLVGVTPGPTTLFTLGMLLLAAGRTPFHLAAIPLLWSFAAGIAAWWLRIPEDYVLPAAGILALCLILLKNRQDSLQRRRSAAKPV
ncbi:MAG: hypothetical protein BroJett029_24740 [Alphaproteobacteria bacterium]|nr:MAG: hypothetical protein BroJett029_24740 [Alphaproteobacteria bacterium]